MTIDML